ncbi:hypothetical protein [Streptomyces sp. NBC_01207]|uniref:hypothetical protein n=1 Tax=Streptomyces sp. NBC_01207 TaxID=2903772 RepID=UPI002E15D231|nr:hypothetical protein OG457_44500 [Streptomyces sp. NBC_01207]
MCGMQDKRQEPGKGREEQERPQRPQASGRDPVHPGAGTPTRGKTPDEKWRREGDALRNERDDLRGGESF